MSAVVISKSPPVVVRPSEPPLTATCDINLSSYDMIFGSAPTTAFFVFEHPIQEAVDTIKRALSQALVNYYPIAGRLALAAGATAGELVIKCTQEELGVSFVAASANCGLKDVAQDLTDPSLQEELAVFCPTAAADRDGTCSSYSDPLLLMQVTVFSCGGLILGVTFNHAVADGVGMGQFLQAVGELCRGLPSPSIVPVRQEDSLILGPPPVFANLVGALGSIQPYQMAVLGDITVKASLINLIKDKYASAMSPGGGRPCTVFEAVAAVLWRCRTRAIMSDSDPEAPTWLILPSNARKYAGAKEGYYGNCILAQLVMATAGAVANGDIMDLVEMIHGAKGRLPDQSDIDQLLRMEEEDWYNHVLLISSWRNIGLEALDFGSGRVARVMRHSRGMVPLPDCTACLPCKDLDDYNVFSICVKEEHASAFLQEIADAARAPYLLSEKLASG